MILPDEASLATLNLHGWNPIPPYTSVTKSRRFWREPGAPGIKGSYYWWLEIVFPDHIVLHDPKDGYTSFETVDAALAAWRLLT